MLAATTLGFALGANTVEGMKHLARLDAGAVVGLAASAPSARFRAFRYSLLGTVFHARVEIFDVIEGERIWLFFRRLHSLYGAYQRYGEAAGIVINAQHPLTLQRYTAAHEYAIASLVMPQAPTMSTASTEGRKTSRRWPLRHLLASS